MKGKINFTFWLKRGLLTNWIELKIVMLFQKTPNYQHDSYGLLLTPPADVTRATGCNGVGWRFADGAMCRASRSFEELQSLLTTTYVVAISHTKVGIITNNVFNSCVLDHLDSQNGCSMYIGKAEFCYNPAIRRQAVFFDRKWYEFSVFLNFLSVPSTVIIDLGTVQYIYSALVEGIILKGMLRAAVIKLSWL